MSFQTIKRSVWCFGQSRLGFGRWKRFMRATGTSIQVISSCFRMLKRIPSNDVVVNRKTTARWRHFVDSWSWIGAAQNGWRVSRWIDSKFTQILVRYLNLQYTSGVYPGGHILVKLFISKKSIRGLPSQWVYRDYEYIWIKFGINKSIEIEVPSREWSSQVKVQQLVKTNTVWWSWDVDVRHFSRCLIRREKSWVAAFGCHWMKTTREWHVILQIIYSMLLLLMDVSRQYESL